MKTHNHNSNDPSHDETAAAEVTAYALGQLHGDELAAMKAQLSATGGEASEQEVRATRTLSAAVTPARNSAELLTPSVELRKAIEARLHQIETPPEIVEKCPAPKAHATSFRLGLVEWIAIGGVVVVLIALLLPASQVARESARRTQASNELDLKVQDIQGDSDELVAIAQSVKPESWNGQQSGEVIESETRAKQLTMSRADRMPVDTYSDPLYPATGDLANEKRALARTLAEGRVSADQRRLLEEKEMYSKQNTTQQGRIAETELRAAEAQAGNDAELQVAKEGILVSRAELEAKELLKRSPEANYTDPLFPSVQSDSGEPLKKAMARAKAMRSRVSGGEDIGGEYGQQLGGKPYTYAERAHFAYIPRPEGLVDGVVLEVSDRDLVEISIGSDDGLKVDHSLDVYRGNQYLSRIVIKKTNPDRAVGQVMKEMQRGQIKRGDRLTYDRSGEQYAPITENPFLSPLQQPLSTFSIDVDTASYANVRRFLTSGRLPPPNAVRIEELVNYFRYDYPQPKGNDPFSVNMEVAECPWREKHLLLRVGLKGKEVPRTERPQSNLVFLLDVSGSMADENKLPLLKTALKMLVGELGENDRVSIVTYAGEAGLKLSPTRGHEQEKIVRVIDSLHSGGSTNGSAGIELAYEQAAAGFLPGGTNRVILCTDGDLNVGVTSDEALVKLIKQKAAGGTFLTVLGFGEGNLKDAKMEKLADDGNGLYAYIDSVREARKALVEQLTGSTITIAKDVKIQIEFNPVQISTYRLLGYENRVLAAEDFNNDKKDAGDIGAGHTVTALYELVPAGTTNDDAPALPQVDALKYQEPEVRGQKSEVGGQPSTTHHSPLTTHSTSRELLTLKLRYKEPTGDTSKLLEYPLQDRGGSFHSASPDLQFAAAVASFGMLLRNSEHRGSSNLAAIAEIATGALGNDVGGYRAEFVDLVRKAQALGAR